YPRRPLPRRPSASRNSRTNAASPRRAGISPAPQGCTSSETRPGRAYRPVARRRRSLRPAKGRSAPLRYGYARSCITLLFEVAQASHSCHPTPALSGRRRRSAEAVRYASRPLGRRLHKLRTRPSRLEAGKDKASHLRSLLLGSVRVVFWVHKGVNKGCFSVHLDHVPDTVQAEVRQSCRNQGVGARLQLRQSGGVVVVAVTHPKGTGQHRNVFVGWMPVGRHSDLTFGTYTDHI